MDTDLMMMAGYLGLAVVGFVVVFLLTPLAGSLGRRFGFVDAVNPAKIHSEAMVRCGGVAIVAGFIGVLGLAIGVVGSGVVDGWLPGAVRLHRGNIGGVLPRLGAVMLGAMVLFVVGLVDDKVTMRPKVKLFWQLVAVVPLLLADITIKGFLPGWAAGAAVTVVWVVLITNAFNLLDNMNGLSSGVACVCGISFFLISWMGGEVFMMGMFALLVGCVAGFIPHNFPRARLFMGDSGSLFIGYMLASLSILVTYYDAGVPTALPVVAPLIVLGVPLFDTLSVMFIRWRNGKPLMVGDQNHFSHRLVSLGFSRVGAVVFIWGVTLTVGLSAVNLRWLSLGGALVALAQVVLFFLIIYGLESAGRRKRG